MPKPLSEMTLQELENVVANHRRKGATSLPAYVGALEELERRKGKGLDFNKSLAIILKAAKAGRFLSYKELTDESGADWNQVRYILNGHLGKLVEYSYRRGWPLLSAIVVNKQNVSTGDMEPETMKGFIVAARDLGIPVGDEVAFLKEQQAEVFARAKSLEMPEEQSNDPTGT